MLVNEAIDKGGIVTDNGVTYRLADKYRDSDTPL